MIASISDSAEPPRRSARLQQRSQSPVQLAAAEMLHNMNGAQTAASFIVKDASENKIASLTTLGNQSIAARKLVESLQANLPTIKLNREDTANVLQFLSDVYSNQLEVVNIS
ncbi:unknown [Choristoneura fumiferana multiple nucleopolyhedrovirus]|uniref:P12 n=1 Tax=Choristoneura fumiferana nuclear polyhedrosis virus TaxID=208973 RepID=Q7TLQ3_NPVCF|nr:unknown [Choristoneura fumiferana multiple nucleopolyhedrovirus]AAP29877.1 unknown [Choristoneura fumiferana multiple nucleopolyhedrovirus]AGR56941.1 P12 [Choristoneura occidentalis alphabaculovirus]